MTQDPVKVRKPSNSYNMYILVLTILSLAVMVVMILPVSQPTYDLLSFYDNIICVLFLIDFAINLSNASSKSEYFFKHGGWLDLIGSIPSFGVFRLSGLLRLARLSRFARILRLLHGENKKTLVADILQNRSQYAAFVTVLLTMIILTTASTLVLQFESAAPDAKILTGADAFWYAIVTITTVGYGDYYPVTAGGRLTAMFIMVAGVGIIGVLASLMSSVLLGAPPEPEDDEAKVVATVLTVEEELGLIKEKLAQQQKLLEKIAEELNRR
jgi:voltage-gated potassium channel